MCTRAECERQIGRWVTFRTPYGFHRGVIERVTPDNKAIILSPRKYAPQQFVLANLDQEDMDKLDLALAWGGFGPRAGYPGAGGAYGGYPGGYGYGYGWARWAVSFLVIYALWGLFFW